LHTHIRRGSAALTAAAACWGVGTVITKQALGEVPALTLLPIQLLASSLLLAGAAIALNAIPAWSPALGRAAALGVLNPGLAYALGLLGLAHISASMAVLLWALEPAVIYVLAYLILGDRTTARERLAIAVAISGVLLVVYQPQARGSTLGITLVLGAVATCAIYTVIARQMLSDQDSLPVVLAQQIAALGFALAVLVIVDVSRGDQLQLEGHGVATWVARSWVVPCTTGSRSGSTWRGFAKHPPPWRVPS
jgi:drug/metabolite transporter (DMT)-like permease